MKIELDRLSFKYGQKQVIDDISMSIPAGDVTAILGVSGSGKSTLIKLMACLLEPCSGDIQFGDSASTHQSKRKTSVVFQDTTLFPWMTVNKNIEIARSQDAMSIDSIAAIVGLQKSLDQYPDQLSGGMKQRAEFGRVLAQNPENLLLDEPFSRLDVQFRARMQETFLEVHKLRKPTTVFVTHDIQEAIRVASHIRVLRGTPVSKVEEYDVHSMSPDRLIAEVGNILQHEFDAHLAWQETECNQ